jgi:hypothetical protein
VIMDSGENSQLEGGDSRVSIRMSEVPTISLLGVVEVAATRVAVCAARRQRRRRGIPRRRAGHCPHFSPGDI